MTVPESGVWKEPLKVRPSGAGGRNPRSSTYRRVFAFALPIGTWTLALGLDTADDGWEPETKGSNGIAISPKNTKDGKALLLINSLSPLLGKLGFGKLPGDFRFRLFGREWFIPLTTTILLSMAAAGIAKQVVQFAIGLQLIHERLGALNRVQAEQFGRRRVGMEQFAERLARPL